MKIGRKRGRITDNVGEENSTKQMRRDVMAVWLLTVNPMPTVAEKEPDWNLPWSNCTRIDVLPTPESPTKIVYTQKYTEENR